MTTTTITGEITDPSGNPLVGVPVIATLDAAQGAYLADDSAELLSRAVTVSGADGSWSLALTPNSEIEPAGTGYRVTRLVDGQAHVNAITVPVSGSPVEFDTILVDASIVGGLAAGGVLAGYYPNPTFADADVTTFAALSPANDDVLQRKAGAWANRTPAQLGADLDLGLLGDVTTTGVAVGDTLAVTEDSPLAFATRTPPAVTVDVSNAAGDTAALVAALAEQTTAGRVNGKWATPQRRLMRISSPTTISLGYSNTQDGSWATETTTEKVRLALDILPDANLGAALTIRGGYGTELDINVLGGGARGSVTDATTTGRSTSADVSLGLTGNRSTVTSATAAFTSADVGAPIAIPGAGTNGVTLYTTISTVTNSTTATVGATSVTAVSGATARIGTFTVSSPQAIAAGLAVGAVVFIPGAGPSPEGVTQPLAASVRSVDAGAGTFTVSEGCWSDATNATMLWFDVAVRLEDCVGLKLNIYGKGFQGYLLGADATNSATRRLRSCEAPSITGNGCGGTLFWKSIEAFGSIGHIMSNTIYGDYVGLGADLHWDHWEGGISQPVQQLARAYLWFDRQGQVNGLSISAGDRAYEAAILMTGDSAGESSVMGRFTQVRATIYQAVGNSATITSGSNQITNVVSQSLTFKVGQVIVGPGLPEGATITAVTGSGNSYTAAAPGTLTISGNATASATGRTIYGQTTDGLKLIGVSGITISHLDTTHCVAGLRVIGGGATGIRVLHHRAGSGDINPLVVQAGATGLTPRVNVQGDYRFVLGYAVDIGAGLGAADIRFSGHVDLVHIGDSGAGGAYAARCASSSVVLDIAGLRQRSNSGLLGFIDPATVALRGRPSARLEDEVPAAGTFYYADGSGGHTARTAGAAGTVPIWQAGGAIGTVQVAAIGSSTAQALVQNTTTATPVVSFTITGGTVAAGDTYLIRAWGNTDNDAGATVTLRLKVGGSSIANTVPITNASARAAQGWNGEWLLQFRAAASTTTPTVVGGQAYNQTSASTAVQGNVSTSLNMTVDRTIVVDATWSAATATNLLRCEGYTVQKVA